jgi:carbon monoxide dehydrogenase subunit G
VCDYARDTSRLVEVSIKVTTMEMSSSQRIEAPLETVWAAINNPNILRQCIPGCQEIERISDTEMVAKVVIKIGPVKASFSGKVLLSDIEPPTACTISGEGSGVAGYAKGGATVHLSQEGGTTVLTYHVTAQVGGKIAQFGARLIEATAKKLAAEFFERLCTVVSEQVSAV